VFYLSYLARAIWAARSAGPERATWQPRPRRPVPYRL